MAKFKKLSAEEIAQLSQEEQAAYYRDLQTYSDQLEAELEKEAQGRADAEGAVKELTAALKDNPVSLSSGKPVITHKGKKYQVNAKFIRLRPAPNAAFETYDIDQITGKGKESAQLRDLLLERGSGILTEV